MARMRTVKPEFWTDKRMIRLSAFARLLYIGSWNFACDAGHLTDDADELKLKVLPADQVDPDELLQEIVDSGRIERRSTPNGRDYLFIPKLVDHQKVDPRWVPRCPVCTDLRAFPEPQASPELTETHGSLDETQRASPKLTETPLISAGMVREGKVREGNKNARAPRSEHDSDFDRFWQAYPKRVSKGQAIRAWRSALKKATADELIGAAKRYADASRNADPKFIAYPATWLNGERWADETPAGAPERQTFVEGW